MLAIEIGPNRLCELEGIFPDGKRTFVECALDHARGMNLCVLDLDAKQRRYTRMTNIARYGGGKRGNPVVRPDGRMVAAQVGSADVIEAGVRRSIVLMGPTQDFSSQRAQGPSAVPLPARHQFNRS